MHLSYGGVNTKGMKNARAAISVLKDFLTQNIGQSTIKV